MGYRPLRREDLAGPGQLIRQDIELARDILDREENGLRMRPDQNLLGQAGQSD